MHTVFADLRYAFRVMSRTPSFAVAVVIVLALGIGASTTIFSIVNAVLLRPLPFEEPDRLVRIFTRPPGGTPFELSPGKFYDWQRDARSFEGMAMYQCCGFRELALTGTGNARTVRATAVTAGFFEVVRARPALGRVFRQEEDTPAGRHVVILSDRFWRTEFAGHSDVIGRTMKLGDEPYTIVGSHAGHCLGRVMEGDGERCLDTARTHRRATRRPWESQSGRRGASQAECRPVAGASRDGRDLRTARA
jgi:hypothetical protein